MKKEREQATAAIQKALSEGITKVDIAAEIGISYPTLNKRLLDHSWKRNEMFLIKMKFK